MNTEMITPSLIRVKGAHDLEYLGIVCNERALTISGEDAIYAETFYPRADFIKKSVTRLYDGATASMAVQFASNMDLVVLAPDSLCCELEEYGHYDIGESPFGVTHFEDFPDRKPLKLAKLEFGDQNHIQVPGFFFAPDGKTTHAVVFDLYKSDYKITFFSDDLAFECRGSPLFTAEGHLIGMLSSSDPFNPESEIPNGFGIRLDQCIPDYIKQNFEWEEVKIG